MLSLDPFFRHTSKISSEMSPKLVSPSATKQLDKSKAKHVLGAQANMWSNFVNTPAHFEYMTYPRLLALAELTWTPAGQTNYGKFEQKLEKHYRRFDEMHLAYRRHDK